MYFEVPQFIQREMKIVGPLTFKQFLFVAAGALGCGLLYIFLMQRSFFLFIVSSLIVMVGGLALAFIRIEGIALPTLITHFFLFLASKKTYLWKKKTFAPRLIEVKKEPAKKAEKKPVSVPTEKSQLGELSTKLEIGIRQEIE